MTREERKGFLMEQDLLEEEAENAADEFTDNADEEDLRVVQIYENYEDLGKDYMDKVVGTIDHHVWAVLDLKDLGKHLTDTCEEYLVCESSGRVIQFEL